MIGDNWNRKRLSLQIEETALFLLFVFKYSSDRRKAFYLKIPFNAKKSFLS